MTDRICDECGTDVPPRVNQCRLCGGPVRVTLVDGTQYVIRRPTSRPRPVYSTRSTPRKRTRS